MYTALSLPFCGGFKMEVSGISLACAGKTKTRHHTIRNDLKAGIGDLIYKDLLLSHRNGSAYIWATLTPETTVLDSRFSKHLNFVLPMVSEHARLFWGAGNGTTACEVREAKSTSPLI